MKDGQQFVVHRYFAVEPDLPELLAERVGGIIEVGERVAHCPMAVHGGVVVVTTGLIGLYLVLILSVKAVASVDNRQQVGTFVGEAGVQLRKHSFVTLLLSVAFVPRAVGQHHSLDEQLSGKDNGQQLHNSCAAVERPAYGGNSRISASAAIPRYAQVTLGQQ